MGLRFIGGRTRRGHDHGEHGKIRYFAAEAGHGSEQQGFPFESGKGDAALSISTACL
jgi:hypothetical protein